MLDFAEIDKYKENNRIEAKRAQGGFPQSLWETYSAFANTVGGVILLGVQELADKSFYPVRLPSPEWLAEEFWRKAEDKQIVSANILSPDQVRIVEARTGGDGSAEDGGGKERIVVIEVPRADRRKKPVFIGSDPYMGSYRRNGEGDYRCTREEVESMLRDADAGSQDGQIFMDLGTEALDEGTMERYIREYSLWQTKDSLEKPVVKEAFWEELGALAKDGKGQYHVTAAGLLMFGKTEQIIEKFPRFLLKYEEYGREAEEEIYYEPSEPDFAETETTEVMPGGWNGNLFDFFLSVCANILEDTRFASEAAMQEKSRKEAQENLAAGIREALANALSHANYYDRNGVLVRKEKEQILIANPGDMRVDAEAVLRGAAPDARNERISRMFHLIGVGDGTGKGLARIRRIWTQRGWNSPRLLEEFNPDRVVLILPLTKGEEERRKLEEKGRREYTEARNVPRLLDYLTDHVRAGIPELAQALGISEKETAGCIDLLLRDGIIMQEEETEGETYRLRD